jgi:group I intron endonuclease
MIKGLHKISGIYKIQSICKPERIYIGSASNMLKRWWRHNNDLKYNKHCNPILQNHYNKYGKSDLEFSIIVGCSKVNLVSYEQFYIDALNPYFNILKIAGNVIGRVCSEKTRKLMSLKHKGKKLSDEHKINLSKARKGINLNPPVTNETRHKMSLARKGHLTSLEARRKISIANKGKKRTEEVKKILSSLKSGKKQSADVIKKRTDKLRGQKRSIEYREYMSKLMKEKGIIPPSRKGCKKLKTV